MVGVHRSHFASGSYYSNPQEIVHVETQGEEDLFEELFLTEGTLDLMSYLNDIANQVTLKVGFILFLSKEMSH